MAEVHEAWLAVAMLNSAEAGVWWNLEMVSTKGGVPQHTTMIHAQPIRLPDWCLKLGRGS